MSENRNETNILLEKVGKKRLELGVYVAKNEPRNTRLINASIISGAIAAALTAGPGLGGGEFIDMMKGSVSIGIPIWQVLCLLATFFSIAAVIINGMLKSDDLTSKVARARVCDAKLEGLETMLELSQVSIKDAAQLYTQYLSEIPHV